MRYAKFESLEGQTHDIKADALAPVLSHFFNKITKHS